MTFKPSTAIAATVILLSACSDVVPSGPERISGPEAPTISSSTGTSATCVPIPSGLVSWWTGDTDASDARGSNHGILRDGATAAAAGLVGGAFGLDGVDDFVEVPPSTSLDITGSITVLAWLNAASFGFHPSVIGKGNVGNYAESFALFVNPDGTTGFLVNSIGAPAGRAVLFGGQLTAGDWHLLAGTYSAADNLIRLYVDDHLIAATGHSGGVHVTPDPVLIGKAERSGTGFPTSFFHGLVDEVQLYDRALDAAELLAVHTAGPSGFCPDAPPPPPPPPPPVASAGGPYDGVEGSALSFDGAASTDPAEQGLSFAWDFGDGVSGAGVAPAHAYGDNETYTVSLTVTDVLGQVSSSTTTATIVNAAPTLGLVAAPVDPQPVGSSVGASVPFTDPGALDSHTAAFNWDAEGVGATSAGAVVDGLATGSHVYTAAGVYTVGATVTDDDGGGGSALFQYVVVYDPTAGFVTGGGHIASPAGSYTADPTLTGKAIFAFVSRYQTGASVPTGNTQFKFKAGSLDFSSTEYEWLVVAGARAQFKGSGMVNGLGDYRFLLTAMDGALPGGGGTDKFRIKLWDEATGTVIYDNQLGGSDTDDPTTAIQGGSIVIHK
jgi:PKD repeat protein